MADIFSLIGSKDICLDWSIAIVKELSIKAWAELNNATHDNSFNDIADTSLQEERQSWIDFFKTYSSDGKQVLDEYKGEQLNNALKSQDKKNPELSPPLSIRWDLKIRYMWRQYVRSLKDTEPYNPSAPSKRNDGIDFDLFNYLLIPAFVVSEDRGFFESLSDIPSYQLNWFWRPANLANAWCNGQKPRPIWIATE